MSIYISSMLGTWSEKMIMALHIDPTVRSGQWDTILEDPAANAHSPFSGSFMNDDDQVMFEQLTTRQLRHLCSNLEMAEYDDVYEAAEEYGDVQVDDQFRMYEFKVKRCGRGRSHDWTDCPYAHPGEKARRRDPRKFHYSGNPCPEFRKGSCKKGDTCEFAHGVFECWLHPSRYRTQPCKDGVQCSRRICFFAHTPEQLRILPASHHVSTHPESYDGSPSRLLQLGSSPTSTLYLSHCSTPSDSPPMSPVSSVGDLALTMRNLQIGKATRLSMSVMSPSVWGGAMERVESGKGVRAQIYAKLSRENSVSE